MMEDSTTLEIVVDALVALVAVERADEAADVEVWLLLSIDESVWRLGSVGVRRVSVRGAGVDSRGVLINELALPPP